MHTIKNFEQANATLLEYRSTQKKPTGYTLERMRELMDYLENPQNRLKVIHVAGTSGKSSTSYYTAALLKQAGYKVGLSISPHVDQVNERAQINLQPLDESVYCPLLAEFFNIVRPSGIKPSYFELLVAFAYWLFDKMHVDYAVIEVGLGGLLDGTNVIDRTDKICVITDIGLDHTEILGNSLSEIAFQKAGIIGNHNQVFMHRQPQEIISTVATVSSARSANLDLIAAGPELDSQNLPLFQRRNFSLANAAAAYALRHNNHKILTRDQIQLASQTYIPARMEVTTYRNKTLVMDGSHNQQKINALVESMQARFDGTPIAMLVSCKNKSVATQDSLKLLKKLGDTIILTSFSGTQDEYRQSIDPYQLVRYCQEAGFKNVHAAPNPNTAFEKLLTCPEPALLVTGSYYLLNHVRPAIRLNL